MEKERCCSDPDIRDAYVWFWPFRAKFCIHCKNAILDTGPILTWIWTRFVWPFWEGQVRVFVENEEE